jgi:hypothetical protein
MSTIRPSSLEVLAYKEVPNKKISASAFTPCTVTTPTSCFDRKVVGRLTSKSFVDRYSRRAASQSCVTASVFKAAPSSELSCSCLHSGYL